LGALNRRKRLWFWLKRNFFLTIVLAISAPALLSGLVFSIIYIIYYHGQLSLSAEAYRFYLNVTALLSGGSFLLVIYTFAMAERINRRLIETQWVASEAVSDFRTLFDRHLLRFLESKKKLRRIKLVLSTPAFGLHPLGLVECRSFILALDATDCPASIVVYSTNAHFAHLLNTLLWEDASDKKRPDLMTLAHLLLEFTKAVRRGYELHEWCVWPTNSGNERLFSFETSTESRVFLVLTNPVSVSADLASFTGRSLPLPSVLREPVVGEDDSLFSLYQVCPYSGATGAKAALNMAKADEFGLLLGDYIVGRTSEVVQSYLTFKSHVDRVMATRGIAPGDRAKFLLDRTKSYLKYLQQIVVDGAVIDAESGQRENIALVQKTAESDRLRKLVVLGGELETLGVIPAAAYEGLKRLVPDLEGIVGQDPEMVGDVGGLGTDMAELHARKLLYAILRWGMGRSQFANHRRA
jgi:hypothetical protein